MQDSVLPQGVGLRKPHITLHTLLLSSHSLHISSLSSLLTYLSSFLTSYSSLLELLLIGEKVEKDIV